MNKSIYLLIVLFVGVVFMICMLLITFPSVCKYTAIDASGKEHICESCFEGYRGPPSCECYGTHIVPISYTLVCEDDGNE